MLPLILKSAKFRVEDKASNLGLWLCCHGYSKTHGAVMDNYEAEVKW
jgi:hypothetical protein